MEEGVSPSLSRNGFSLSSELGFSSSWSVSVSVSVSFFGGSNFPDDIHLTSFSSVISVSSTWKHVSYGGSYLPELQESIGDGAWSHKQADEATDSTHSVDLLETAPSGMVPSRSKVGLPVPSSLGRGLVGAGFPTSPHEFGHCSTSRSCELRSKCELFAGYRDAQIWVPDPVFKSLPTPATRSLGLILTG